MIKVKISCPITWSEQCKWIWDNCIEWKDTTNWAAWQIGLDDIYFYIPERDATMFFLKWP
jgi:hypothetical protein